MSAKQVKNVVSETVTVFDETVSGVAVETEQLIASVRKSVFKRFPVLFLLLVTFGVTAVVYSFERIMTDVVYLHDRPWLILLIGLGTLVSTGTLYEKLG